MMQLRCISVSKVCHPATCQIHFQLELLSIIDRQDIEINMKIWNNLSKDLREIIHTKVFKRRLINELSCNMN